VIVPLNALRWLWMAWVVSWGIAARWANRTQARAAVGAELTYRVPTIVGVALLFLGQRHIVGSALSLWETPWVLGWCLVGVAAAGFAFCWWARIHLGRLWSSSVTRKADHHIVDTGPYAWVRHPIYTGIITAAAAMAVLEGTIVALLGFVVMVVALWMKARLEERFLRQELGAAHYDEYARRTSMLFPGL
jgi:protein-S-isoprenylcysteine O-methyltransferase Ste14